jgi:hypothetical protein
MSAKCRICTKAIYPMDPQINLDGTKFHKPCAKCADCGCQITVSNFTKNESSDQTVLLCKTHYFKRFHEGGSYLGGDKFKVKADRDVKSSSPAPLSHVSSSAPSPADHVFTRTKLATTPTSAHAPIEPEVQPQKLEDATVETPEQRLATEDATAAPDADEVTTPKSVNSEGFTGDEADGADIITDDQEPVEPLVLQEIAASDD